MILYNVVKGSLQLIALKPYGSIIVAGGAIVLTFVNSDIRAMLTGSETISGQIREMGATGPSIALLLITALVKTSLSEEIFFRGFVAKRLIAWLGFQRGNLIQALIFGVLHILIFLTVSSTPVFLVFIFILSGTGAWVTAYINERISNGSILPGWIAHGLGNALSYSITAFVI